MDEKNKQKAFRYLTAPPISADDLMTVADATLTASRLRVDPSEAARIRDTVLTILDPHRFPWIADKRSPTDEERRIAVVASAALAACLTTKLAGIRRVALFWQHRLDDLADFVKRAK